MLIIRVSPGDRIICRSQTTGEVLEIHFMRKKGGGAQLGFDGLNSFRCRRESAPEGAKVEGVKTPEA